MTTQVSVLGGGYAGVMAANRLQRRGGIEVTLVSPTPDFVDRIRLHQMVTGTHSGRQDYRRVLSPQVRRVHDRAERIDRGNRSVLLASGARLRYDHLLLAVGSAGTSPDIAGAEHVQGVATIGAAQQLRRVLARTAPGATVTVVGGGSTGIETAAELATTGWRVTLACGGQLGPSLHERGRRSAAAILHGLDVDVLEGTAGRVVAASATEVTLADGRARASEVTVWATGFSVPDLAHSSGLASDATGRLVTDETLTCVDDPRIVAAGDVAAPSGGAQRMSCQAAMPLGAQAAETILSRIAGDPPADLTNGFAGQCLSLGRRSGVLQLAHPDDTPRAVHLRGRPAAWAKEVTCRAVVRGLVTEARRPGSFRWPRDPGRAARPTRSEAEDEARIASDPGAEVGAEVDGRVR
ncbi:FAD-dependent oxidoreductase [Janibacter alkaliphilus]|uniref:NADH dehydrogenase FAD-containing subunit n=1 Tax=Janibacter alkaliphilus TaxID=1069963 RepID=A0A852X4F6_9MICO|nr:FAD-dependent oxidoreductase [Janibacter alkaliphilus]NYG37926.1 NADH dehydrogenase FAD-containing subunit [Janibacter alkaliphilus]